MSLMSNQKRNHIIPFIRIIIVITKVLMAITGNNIIMKSIKIKINIKIKKNK